MLIDIDGSVEVAFNVVLGHRQFGAIANRIVGIAEDQVFPIRSWSTSQVVRSPEVPQELGAQTKTIQSQILADDIDNYIEKFASERPDGPSGAQLNHLAALAWKADFSPLDDYLATFKKGNRLNFVPAVTEEMVDRAMTLAAERK